MTQQPVADMKSGETGHVSLLPGTGVNVRWPSPHTQESIILSMIAYVIEPEGPCRSLRLKGLSPRYTCPEMSVSPASLSIEER